MHILLDIIKFRRKLMLYLNTFISYNNIDYYYSLNNKMNAHHPKINFKDAVDKSQFNSYEPYKLIDDLLLILMFIMIM